MLYFKRKETEYKNTKRQYHYYKIIDCRKKYIIKRLTIRELIKNHIRNNKLIT